MRFRAWHLQREREEELYGAQGLWEAVAGIITDDFEEEQQEFDEEGEEGEEEVSDEGEGEEEESD